jgi:hypothetical protein
MALDFLEMAKGIAEPNFRRELPHVAMQPPALVGAGALPGLGEVPQPGSLRPQKPLQRPVVVVDFQVSRPPHMRPRGNSPHGLFSGPAQPDRENPP